MSGALRGAVVQEPVVRLGQRGAEARRRPPAHRQERRSSRAPSAARRPACVASKRSRPRKPTTSATARAAVRDAHIGAAAEVDRGFAVVVLRDEQARVAPGRASRRTRAAGCRCPRPTSSVSPRCLASCARRIRAGMTCPLSGPKSSCGPNAFAGNAGDELAAVLAAVGVAQLPPGELGRRVGLARRLQRHRCRAIRRASAAARASGTRTNSRGTAASPTPYACAASQYVGSRQQVVAHQFDRARRGSGRSRRTCRRRRKTHSGAVAAKNASVASVLVRSGSSVPTPTRRVNPSARSRSISARPGSVVAAGDEDAGVAVHDASAAQAPGAPVRGTRGAGSRGRGRRPRSPCPARRR